MTRRIDINCDMGEFVTGQETESALMPFISSANISCGAHSPHSERIPETIRQAHDHGIKIGAHPSYPDRDNFGRKVLPFKPSRLMDSITQQLEQFLSYCYKAHVPLHHVKAHGALYNRLSQDRLLAEHYLETLIKLIPPETRIYGMAHSAFEDWVIDCGLTFTREAFADRRYTDRTELQSRHLPGSLITTREEMLAQVQMLLHNSVKDSHGRSHTIIPETICLHSDTPNAPELGGAIAAYLAQNGIEITCPC